MIQTLLTSIASVLSTSHDDTPSNHSELSPCAAQLHCNHPADKQYERLDDGYVHRLCECGAYLSCRDATPADATLEPWVGTDTTHPDNQ
ncbi:hypothetical protein MUK72_15080 (plasmid) [Halococcus dombrowskii]|uniref:Uncharacterized protein n=1 Tax=Halococcus dombrowskii TaxID=179637 RepID=A0AAV3SBZ8_HALDO|nr:hypothetical protein [Halococcus dombrowskii]UOO96842.1 hypothetical protein MUK72_15080 [Halococcus dombrowskii]